MGKFIISFNNVMNLEDTVGHLLTDEQHDLLSDSSRNLLEYEVTGQVLSLGEIKMTPICSTDLHTALNIIQEDAKNFDAYVLIVAAQAIWEEAVRFTDSPEAWDLAYQTAKGMCRESA